MTCGWRSKTQPNASPPAAISGPMRHCARRSVSTALVARVGDAQVRRRMDIGIAALRVGAGEICINPLGALSFESAKFVVAHESLHTGLCHSSRREGRDPCRRCRHAAAGPDANTSGHHRRACGRVDVDFFSGPKTDRHLPRTRRGIARAQGTLRGEPQGTLVRPLSSPGDRRVGRGGVRAQVVQSFFSRSMNAGLRKIFSRPILCSRRMPIAVSSLR